MNDSGHRLWSKGGKLVGQRGVRERHFDWSLRYSVFDREQIADHTKSPKEQNQAGNQEAHCILHGTNSAAISGKLNTSHDKTAARDQNCVVRKVMNSMFIGFHLVR